MESQITHERNHSENMWERIGFKKPRSRTRTERTPKQMSPRSFLTDVPFAQPFSPLTSASLTELFKQSHTVVVTETENLGTRD